MRAPLPPGAARQRAARAVPERRRAGLLGRHLRAYVVAGAIAGWHFEQLCAFTRRHLRHRPARSRCGGRRRGRGHRHLPDRDLRLRRDAANASAVFQPIVILEALAFGWALLGAGLLWSDRGAPHRKFAAAGSASSFGIYLAHPLVLQGLLLVAGRQLPRRQRRLARRGPHARRTASRCWCCCSSPCRSSTRIAVADRLGGAADAGQPDAHRARVQAAKKKGSG